jgi:hypothetical protein
LEHAVLVILKKHIQTIIELDKCLKLLDRIPFRQLHLKKAEERLKKAEEEISRFRGLKISLYEDMKEGIVSKDDYWDINSQYESRIQLLEQSKIQIHREMDKLLNNATEQQLWMKDFIKTLQNSQEIRQSN